jgi:hypothetical protein
LSWDYGDAYQMFGSAHGGANRLIGGEGLLFNGGPVFNYLYGNAYQMSDSTHGGQNFLTNEHPGYCGAQDTFYVGNLKGVGRIYQQTLDSAIMVMTEIVGDGQKCRL